MTEEKEYDSEEDDIDDEALAELERKRQARFDIMLKYLIKTKTKEELAQVIQEMTAKSQEMGERL